MATKENGNLCDGQMSEPQRLESARTLLREQYGIAGEVVRAGPLANVLGMTAQTVRRGMQSGDFFLPCTRILSSTVVKVEDLARWICRSERPLCAESEDSGGSSTARIKEQALKNMRKKIAARY